MANKRIRANLYTETKFSTKGGHWHYESLPDGRLYSNRVYPTNITKEDLPEWFMHGRFYKNFGYLSAKGIKDLKYVPNYVFNHFHKDDDLYISYNELITSYIETNDWGRERIVYDNYDERIDGGQILEFILLVQKYSTDIDVKPIIADIYKKSRWMIETYPDDIEVKSSDRIAYLDSIFGGDPNLESEG